MSLTPSLKIFNASAGSGKTYEITYNYIRDVMEVDSRDQSLMQFHNILAITFTNKAAAEMKSRILKELFLLSKGESGMMDRLCSELSVSAEKVIQKAAFILTSILHNYSRFSVSTIDSFMQRIIRYFARELQMQSDYEVVVREDELYSFIIENLFLKVYRGGELESYMLNYAAHLFDNEKKPEEIKNELIRQLGVLSRESPTAVTDALSALDDDKMAAFSNSLNRDIKALSERIKAIDEEVKAGVVQLGLTPKLYRGQSLQKMLEKWISKGYSDLNVSETKMMSGEALFENASAEQEALFHDRLIEAYGCTLKKYELEMIRRNIYAVGLSNVMWKEKALYMEVENTLPVSEFNEKISKVVRGEAVPFIYLRAGEKFKDIMIDEFQDTSVKQWHNLVPLLHETLSKHGKVYLVGDPKQSIYRWRSGQPEIMLSLPSIFQNDDHWFDDAEKSFRNALTDIPPMDTNYRSASQIIDFNNAFFCFVKETILKLQQTESPLVKNVELNAKAELIYRHYKQKKHHSTEGYIEFQFLKETVDEADEAESGGNLFDVSVKDIIANAIQRGFRQNDVAIIARDKKTLLGIARYLMLNTEFNVMSDETLQLDFSLRCRLLVSIFNFFSRQNDKLDVFELFFLLQKGGWISNVDSLKDNQRLIDKALESVFNIRRQDFERYASMNLSVEYLFERLLQKFPSDVFLLFFREEVMNFCRIHGFSAENFRLWWTETGSKANVIFPEGAEAVTIMTIHKSKGLQFPIVILPAFTFNEEVKALRTPKWTLLDNEESGPMPVLLNLTKSVQGTRFSPMAVQEKVASAMDTLNLMYVALTRTEREMYILQPIVKDDVIDKEPEKSKEFQLDSSSLIQRFCHCGGYFPDSVQERSDEFGVSLRRYSKGVQALNEKQNIEKSDHLISLKNHHVALPPLQMRGYESGGVLLRREKILAGKVVHSLLESIRTASDIPLAIQRFSRKNHLGFSPDVMERIVNLVIVKSGDLFSDDAVVWNEREMVDENGSVFRPDRIAKIAGGLLIADFKTGKQEEEHVEQLKNYRSLLQKMNYNVVSTMIIYIHFDKESVELVEV